jgi:hypothetical protein
VPIEEKNWKEIEEEYERSKREKAQMRPGEAGWSKCPKCQGTFKVTCPSCKGLGRNLSAHSRSVPCPNCNGNGKANCQYPGCQGGWIKATGTKG